MKQLLSITVSEIDGGQVSLAMEMKTGLSPAQSGFVLGAVMKSLDSVVRRTVESMKTLEGGPAVEFIDAFERASDPKHGEGDTVICHRRRGLHE